MFQLLVQWFAVTTAVPVVAILGIVIALSLSPYKLKRLRIRLLTLVVADLRDILGYEPGLRIDERDAARRAATMLEREREKALTDLDAGERRSAEAASALGFFESGTTSGTDRTAVDDRIEQQWKVAERRLQSRFDGAGPKAVARWGSTWATLETLRVTWYALMHEGRWTGARLLRWTGQHVTDGTVVGLVLSVCAWVIIGGYRANFLIYVANGASLGAFGGLGVTSVLVAHRAIDPAWRRKSGAHGKPSAVRTLIVIYIVLGGLQLLAYVGQYWWLPLSKRP